MHDIAVKQIIGTL